MSIGIRSGDRVQVTAELDRRPPAQLEATFVGLDTARDGVTAEAVIVERDHRRYRFPLDGVLLAPMREVDERYGDSE